jgi:hypothetical protein
MGPLVMAWIVGEGIITYRSVKVSKAPPGPGQLLLSSGVFVLLAIVAESRQARPVAMLAAWGFDIAAFMNIYAIGGPKGPAGPTAKGDATAVNGGGWPPPIAPNTVIFPTGSTASTTSQSGSGGSASPGGVVAPPGGAGGASTPTQPGNPVLQA